MQKIIILWNVRTQLKWPSKDEVFCYVRKAWQLQLWRMENGQGSYTPYESTYADFFILDFIRLHIESTTLNPKKNL